MTHHRRKARHRCYTCDRQAGQHNGLSLHVTSTCARGGVIFVSVCARRCCRPCAPAAVWVDVFHMTAEVAKETGRHEGFLLIAQSIFQRSLPSILEATRVRQPLPFIGCLDRQANTGFFSDTAVLGFSFPGDSGSAAPFVYRMSTN